ncbi:MAG: hypothetical protein CO186_04570 [Zetaproteobacteria bacterium CG_4_9_14_3_um_filter_49_83]|nr:MAG: hypothetical protein AUJ56_00760 [Zetaproteobacteria bacterium CG1_02_49_23]PIQ31484.1 MAG: hypothetical protein COW62_09460 [Zetaproteobacteria bacterium CG17_big_fil_post_rev_8_21_14_2_50_50_13]PIV29809.1 MAG: hypothetical protein COS35_10110 [Zetaproteobacteria bacterium CG02_land_8_20_14_3_00_50_9]PIY54637.1 MAG: hypothetical protein COZ00_13910 [Zetaproteobacteria bacterium CG_4_10_14_0_8_um_filter_49_80]PJA35633.1 MAG: hypothetical protein CO186_04570 [Zetaproteobacteria bacterium
MIVCRYVMSVFTAVFLLCTGTAQAFEPLPEKSAYHVTQGGILSLTLGKQASGQSQIKAFDIDWPCRQKDDGVRCWIGVDLATEPGLYTASWQAGSATKKLQFNVEKGDFRISRITVEKNMATFDEASLKRLRADQQALKQSYVRQVDGQPDLDLLLKPAEGVTSTPFGAQRYVNGEARSPHSGVDIAAAEGTAVIAPLAGEVILAASMFLNGNTLVIGHGNGLVSVFSHLKQMDVKLGDYVRQGQVIAQIGQTGRATGPHLHWGLRFRQARVDPYALTH